MSKPALAGRRRKLVVGVVLALTLAHLYFGIACIRTEVSKAMNRTSAVRAPVTTGKTKPSLPPKTTPTTLGIPKDVLADGMRSDASIRSLCPLIPPNLVGYIAPDLDVFTLDAVEEEFPDVVIGGRFRPRNCTSRHRVAILIPYRDRAENLKIFIYNIHRVLAQQQLDYGVFVIEQSREGKFNRAKLFNIGFLESIALYDYQCFVFHDVDLIPIDDRNVYTCPHQPRHMTMKIDNVSYVPHAFSFGAVSALNKEHMLLVNGYSNRYWGWGGEDDDMELRIHGSNLNITRRRVEIGSYISLSHSKSQPNPDRYRLLQKWKGRWKEDGLNSVKYKRIDLKFMKLYTWILVDVSDRQNRT